jgi:anti-anti-sigma regulatory factor
MHEDPSLRRMAMKNAPYFVELYSSSPRGLRAQATAAANETLRRRGTTLLLGLDNVPTLDDGVLSATIVALRRLREVGGTVRLVTQNSSHRKRLAITGLDRVFYSLASAEETMTRDNRRRGEQHFREFAVRAAQTFAEMVPFAKARQL